MSILSKDRKITIIPGTVGQVGRDAIPAKDGYYTTITTKSYELVTTPVEAEPVEATPTEVEFSQNDPTTTTTTTEPVVEITNEEKYNIRLATYKEIVDKLWWGSDTALCSIRAFIMETINNTEYQFTPLYTFYKTASYKGETIVNTHILTVAYLDSYDATGIVYAEQVPGEPWPTDIRSPTYDFMHPTEDYPDWEFEDYYDCEIINGVEVMTKK